MLAGWWYDFISIVYPRSCLACREVLLRHEKHLCLGCLHALPVTGFHHLENNPVANQFTGKINFEAAASYYYFSKGGKVQHLIHNFKYKGHKELGKFIGNLYGIELKTAPSFAAIDYIIPVPLHPIRFKERGYNQAEWFAMGLAESMGTKLDNYSLKRIYASQSQTHKSRFSRWENVKEIFALGESTHLAHKHVLLVDDVITTGSTLEAAGHVLMQIPGIRVSICSMACALH